MPLGLEPEAPPLPAASGQSTRAALEDEVRAALVRPPCVVTFSGGRDSSAILALATLVARREGLPEPIAHTWRFPDVPTTHESEWQELVIAHLGLRDWERPSFSEELELLGDVATAGLLAHGLLWPPNLHLHVPALDSARGGSVLTGWDGDRALGGRRFARAQAVLHRRVRPEPRDVLRVGFALAPRPVRHRVRNGASKFAANFPWLRPSARRELIRRSLAIPSPRRFHRWVAAYARERYLRVAVLNLAVVAAERDVTARHPLASARFLAALASEGGAVGMGATRTEVMRALFADLLPDEVLTRRTKAEFGRALWGPRSRAFAADWDGSGIDPELVDQEALRTAWRSENPLFGSGGVLQAAWLAGRTAS
jgi:hypothetical protein